MAKWTVGTETFKGKISMFDAMRNRLGIGARFVCKTSAGKIRTYEITKYGYARPQILADLYQDNPGDGPFGSEEYAQSRHRLTSR